MASWFGNCELDAVIEDEAFARQMEDMYVEDLKNATEVVLDAKQKVRAPGVPPRPFASSTGGSGSAGRAAAGAVRIGNAIGAAFTNRRELGPVEARLMTTVAVLLLGLALLFGVFPRVLVNPLIVIFVWIAVALFYKAFKVYRQRSRSTGNCP
jgi:cardiolipin synthase